MDPNFKMLLDEIKVVQTSIANIDSRLSSRIDFIEHTIAGRFDKIEQQSRCSTLGNPRSTRRWRSSTRRSGRFARPTSQWIESGLR
jgi:hypothetical protein